MQEDSADQKCCVWYCNVLVAGFPISEEGIEVCGGHVSIISMVWEGGDHKESSYLMENSVLVSKGRWLKGDGPL